MGRRCKLSNQSFRHIEFWKDLPKMQHLGDRQVPLGRRENLRQFIANLGREDAEPDLFNFGPGSPEFKKFAGDIPAVSSFAR